MGIETRYWLNTEVNGTDRSITIIVRPNNVRKLEYELAFTKTSIMTKATLLFVGAKNQADKVVAFRREGCRFESSYPSQLSHSIGPCWSRPLS